MGRTTCTVSATNALTKEVSNVARPKVQVYFGPFGEVDAVRVFKDGEWQEADMENWFWAPNEEVLDTGEGDWDTMYRDEQTRGREEV